MTSDYGIRFTNMDTYFQYILCIWQYCMNPNKECHARPPHWSWVAHGIAFHAVASGISKLHSPFEMQVNINSVTGIPVYVSVVVVITFLVIMVSRYVHHVISAFACSVHRCIVHYIKLHIYFAPRMVSFATLRLALLDLVGNSTVVRVTEISGLFPFLNCLCCCHKFKTRNYRQWIMNCQELHPRSHVWLGTTTIESSLPVYWCMGIMYV